MSEHSGGDDADSGDQSRLTLVWDVIVFQFKLAADGLRDLALVPISLVAALAGLLVGGSRPARYFHQVLKFGRRTEYWINLFGYRRRGATSDDILRPIQDRVFEEAENNPWLQKAGTKIDKTLDNVGQAIVRGAGEKPPEQKSGEDV